MARRTADEHTDESALFDLCNDFFVLGLQIQAGNIQLPTCESLKRRVLLLFESLKNRSHEAGVRAADVDDASYALAAYLDEMIQYSAWPGKQEWARHPLQAVLYGESKAGTRFFERLEGVRRQSEAALRIYYSCMVLGFMGEHRTQHGPSEYLQQLIGDLRRELFRRFPKALSVNGDRPDDRGLGGRNLPFGALAGLSLLLSVVVIAILYWIVTSSQAEAISLLGKMGRG